MHYAQIIPVLVEDETEVPRFHGTFLCSMWPSTGKSIYISPIPETTDALPLKDMYCIHMFGNSEGSQVSCPVFKPVEGIISYEYVKAKWTIPQSSWWVQWIPSK